MWRRRRVALALMVLATSVMVRADDSSYRVIVNPKNPTTVLDRKFIEAAFLKKISSWPSGDTIKPVDLPSSSATRRTFTSDVLGRSVEEVRRYWQQRIFSGQDVPPPERGSDDDVVKYVLEHDGAIGYVSARTNLGGTHAVVVQ